MQPKQGRDPTTPKTRDVVSLVLHQRPTQASGLELTLDTALYEILWKSDRSAVRPAWCRSIVQDFADGSRQVFLAIRLAEQANAGPEALHVVEPGAREARREQDFCIRQP